MARTLQRISALLLPYGVLHTYSPPVRQYAAIMTATGQRTKNDSILTVLLSRKLIILIILVLVSAFGSTRTLSTVSLFSDINNYLEEAQEQQQRRQIGTTTVMTNDLNGEGQTIESNGVFSSSSRTTVVDEEERRIENEVSNTTGISEDHATTETRNNNTYSSLSSATNNSIATKPPLFFVWLGTRQLEGTMYEAAIDSCRKVNGNDLDIRVIGDADLLDPETSLGFPLHPLFHLLDNVQKSDYLRQELLHFHGGFYLDADVFCARPLIRTWEYLHNTTAVGGGCPTLPRGDLNNNMLGPYLPNSTYTQDTHDHLWRHLESLRPKLNQCQIDHPNGSGGIQYPDPIKCCRGLCGTPWGVMIDFNLKRTRQAYASGVLVRTLKMCPDNTTVASSNTCDLLHVGCAGRKADCKSPENICRSRPLLRHLWSACAAEEVDPSTTATNGDGTISKNTTMAADDLASNNAVSSGDGKNSTEGKTPAVGDAKNSNRTNGEQPDGDDKQEQDSAVAASARELENEPTASTTNTTTAQDSQKPPIFFIWLGTRPLEGIYEAAIDSCRRMNSDHFDIRIVTDEDLVNSTASLGFELHPYFHLLDPVQKSDYLRQELLHFHGGIYLDADVFCARPLQFTLDMIQRPNDTNTSKPVGGGSPHLPRGDLNNNMLGPYLKNSTYTRDTHRGLWKRLDELKEKLEQCKKDHPDGNGGIAYPARVMYGNGLCGTKWGVMIDFNMRRTRQAYANGELVRTFQKCDDKSIAGSCDLLHISCALGRNQCHDPVKACQKTPILKEANLWPACGETAEKRQSLRF